MTLNRLGGSTYRDLERFDESLKHLGRSPAIRRDIGDRRGEAEILYCTGKIQVRVGQAGQAREAWTAALAILTDRGAPQAADAARQLEVLDRE